MAPLRDPPRPRPRTIALRPANAVLRRIIPNGDLVNVLVHVENDCDAQNRESAGAVEAIWHSVTATEVP